MAMPSPRPTIQCYVIETTSGTAFQDKGGDCCDDPFATMMLDRFSNRQYRYTCQFDFETGYLVESPCRCCAQNDQLPHCAPACRMLDRIQGLLADTIPCTRRS